MRQKKEQIRSVIEKTGYQPSAQARILRTKKASPVGVVVPKINSESISRATAGIEKILSEQNYQMLLAGTDNTPAKAFNDDRVEKEPLITDEKLSVAPFGIFSVTCC